MEFRFSSPIGRATGASVLLHASGLATILLLIGRTAPEPVSPGAMVELRLVEVQGFVQTFGNPSPNPLPLGEGAFSLPLPLREGAGGRGATGNSTTNALSAGPGVIPAQIDAQWHNAEPIYPPDAAQRREAGTVLLIVHVGPDGAVEGIAIAGSSGFPELDRAARTAVERWHFLPAVHDGRKVASEMPLRIVFKLN